MLVPGQGPAARPGARCCCWAPSAIPQTAAIRAAVAAAASRRCTPTGRAASSRTPPPRRPGWSPGGTMEWPLLAAADLIIGLGVDEAEMIPASLGLRRAHHPGRRAAASPRARPARPGQPIGSYFTGATALTGCRWPERLEVLATAAGHDWPPAAGRAARADAAAGWPAAAAASAGAAGPAAGRRDGPGAHPAGDHRHRGRGRAHAGVMPLWEVTSRAGCSISSGLATMGFALPAAIAAALCAPREPVVAFTGDGGLGMTLAEIETAVRLVAADHGHRVQRRRAQPHQDQAETGRAGRRRGGRLRPGLLRGAATAMGAAGAAVTEPRPGWPRRWRRRCAGTRSHGDRCARRSGRLSGGHGR